MLPPSTGLHQEMYEHALAPPPPPPHVHIRVDPAAAAAVTSVGRGSSYMSPQRVRSLLAPLSPPGWAICKSTLQPQLVEGGRRRRQSSQDIVATVEKEAPPPPRLVVVARVVYRADADADAASSTRCQRYKRASGREGGRSPLSLRARERSERPPRRHRRRRCRRWGLSTTFSTSGSRSESPLRSPLQTGETVVTAILACQTECLLSRISQSCKTLQSVCSLGRSTKEKRRKTTARLTSQYTP
jgi:hypothetical protein